MADSGAQDPATSSATAGQPTANNEISCDGNGVSFDDRGCVQKEKEHKLLYSFSILIDYLSDEVFPKVFHAIKENQIQVIDSLADAGALTWICVGIGSDGNVCGLIVR